MLLLSLAILSATPATITNQLAAARPGDTIQLQASASPYTINIAKKNYSPVISILGAEGVTVKNVNVTLSSGINFSGIGIVAGPAANQNSTAFRVYQSSFVNVTKSVIVGGLATTGIVATQMPAATGGTGEATGNVIGYPSGKGMSIDGCISCSVTFTEVTKFHTGIAFGSSPNLKLDNNFVHDLRTTPIKGQPAANLTITNNKTMDSKPWKYGGLGDHGDMLHLWVDTGNSPKGLVIKNNQFLQGTGLPIMGIFLQSKGGTYPSVDVSDNTVATSNGQGVILNMTSGKVANTTLIWTSPSTILERVSRKPINWREQPRLDIKAGSSNLTVSGTKGGPVTPTPLTAAMKAAGVVVLP